MSIYVKLNMEEIPENCSACAYEHCNLPYKKNTYKDQIKKIIHSKATRRMSAG